MHSLRNDFDRVNRDVHALKNLRPGVDVNSEGLLLHDRSPGESDVLARTKLGTVDLGEMASRGITGALGHNPHLLPDTGKGSQCYGFDAGRNWFSSELDKPCALGTGIVF